MLATYFLEKYTRKYKKNITGISREARTKLMKYNWPGNVRELQHALERAVILAEGTTLKPENFMLQPAPLRRGSHEELNLGALEKDAVERALRRAGGNVSHAAELLGITRFTLYRKLEKLGL